MPGEPSRRPDRGRRAVLWWLLSVASTAAAGGQPAAARRAPQAIAHRGASAYAPENTLAAFRLAIAQGADGVEPDLGLTRDGVLICLHDDSLERTTNVATVFPDRATRHGLLRRRTWRAVDFTLEEIGRLDAGRWFDPLFTGERIPTWEEAVSVVAPRAGLYPELKSPDMYRRRGMDIGQVFARSVRHLGLDEGPPERLTVQSFDARVLRQLARDLPAVARMFLIGRRGGGRWLTERGLAEIAGFATGIGPHKVLLDGRPGVVVAAQAAGLRVAPYTFSSAMRTRFSDVQAEMRYYLEELRVDALFTDNPDLFPR
jgi:glycerophosphoryl diester phosphodiesterase